jgi:hypothetical protein
MVEYKYSVVSGFGCAEIIWGEMKREWVVGSKLVCEDNSSVLVRWRNGMPSSITAYLSVLVQSTK